MLRVSKSMWKKIAYIHKSVCSWIHDDANMDFVLNKGCVHLVGVEVELHPVIQCDFRSVVLLLQWLVEILLLFCRNM